MDQPFLSFPNREGGFDRIATWGTYLKTVRTWIREAAPLHRSFRHRLPVEGKGWMGTLRSGNCDANRRKAMKVLLQDRSRARDRRHECRMRIRGKCLVHHSLQALCASHKRALLDLALTESRGGCGGMVQLFGTRKFLDREGAPARIRQHDPLDTEGACCRDVGRFICMRK